MLISAADGELAALVVAGVDPSDFLDPAGRRWRAWRTVGFVISLETRRLAVTERADVVFPVALIEERPGTFVNWEGRAAQLRRRDRRAERDDRPAGARRAGRRPRRRLGFRTAAQARAELDELGAWAGARAPPPPSGPAEPSAPADGAGGAGDLAAALDDSPAVDDEPYLLDDRPPAGRPAQPDDRGRGRARPARHDHATTAARSPSPVVIDPRHGRRGRLGARPSAPGLEVGRASGGRGRRRSVTIEAGSNWRRCAR